MEKYKGMEWEEKIERERIGTHQWKQVDQVDVVATPIDRQTARRLIN